MKLKYTLLTLLTTSALSQAAVVINVNVANVTGTGGDLVDAATGITFGTYTTVYTTSGVTLNTPIAIGGDNRVTANYGALADSVGTSLNVLVTATLNAAGTAGGYNLTGSYVEGLNGGGFFGAGAGNTAGHIELTIDQAATLDYSNPAISWTDGTTPTPVTIASGTALAANTTIFSSGGEGSQGVPENFSFTTDSASFNFEYASEGNNTLADGFKFGFLGTVVPEPSSTALLGLGAVAFMVRRKR